ncbi:hypothetical protein ILYODFUR_035845 [Ilyodon furcidens]|uniref:Uncharacterized protein n=1 Tax=Ilyodon furcidens TaxID=33524 RepID=A0ABV0VJW7_9TELE
MQRTQICSFQENFTDYPLSWQHSGFKAPLAYLQTNLAHPPLCSPSKITHLVPPPSQGQVRQDYLDQLTYLTHSRSFHPSFPPWQIFKSLPRQVPVSSVRTLH